MNNLQNYKNFTHSLDYVWQTIHRQYSICRQCNVFFKWNMNEKQAKTLNSMMENFCITITTVKNIISSRQA